MDKKIKKQWMEVYILSNDITGITLGVFESYRDARCEPVDSSVRPVIECRTVQPNKASYDRDIFQEAYGCTSKEASDKLYDFLEYFKGE